MITINVYGSVFENGKKVTIYNALKTHLDDSLEGSKRDMESTVRGLGKFFTKHIQGQLRKNKPKGKHRPIATGRIFESSNLVTLGNDASVVQEDGGTRYFFNYTFPKNFGYEYGYPLGDISSKLSAKDGHLAKWIMDKGGFKYITKNKSGDIKSVEITKPYQARSVAFIMQKSGEEHDRKFNVPNWYVITRTNTEIQKKMNSLKNLRFSILKKRFNGN